MTSKSGSNVDLSGPPSSSSSPSFHRSSPGPKLHVQRSLSRDTITIHFSTQGKEEEEDDEELYGLAVPSSGLDVDDRAIVTALEASEELQFVGTEAEAGSGFHPRSSATALNIEPSFTTTTSVYSPSSSSLPSEHWPQPAKPPPSSASSTSSPVKSTSVHSKPFLSLVRSLSTDVEPRESPSAPSPQPMRHRHLMKTLVKSLSTDTARPDMETQRLPESRRNLHLFKPFAQPRVPTTAAGDSKTAPSSPVASPDGRSFFKVQEVEARLEDTKRRLSEVMCEHLQLFSKIIGEEGGNTTPGTVAHHPNNLSSSASELSNLATLNGHLEDKNDYCIKEEDDLEGESPPGKPMSRSPPLGLDRCFMSALARQEDEEFCELYSEDFELCTDTEVDCDLADSTRLHRASTAGSEEPTEGGEEEEEDDEKAPGIPHHGLFLVISIVYGYLVLPLPTYLGGVLLGVAAGFMLAILVVWLSAPRRSRWGPRFSRCKKERWNGVPLDIKEPTIYKVGRGEVLYLASCLCTNFATVCLVS